MNVFVVGWSDAIPRLHLEAGKYRPLRFQDIWERRAERLQLVMLRHNGPAGATSHRTEICRSFAWERMPAVGLVSSVLANEVDQVFRPSVGSGDERREVHEEAAVAIEHDYLPVRSAKRQT